MSTRSPAAPATPAPTCPRCAGVSVMPIAYGHPGEELMTAYERGEVELGGCVVRDEQPHAFCRDCGHRW